MGGVKISVFQLVRYELLTWNCGQEKYAAFYIYSITIYWGWVISYSSERGQKLLAKAVALKKFGPVND